MSYFQKIFAFVVVFGSTTRALENCAGKVDTLTFAQCQFAVLQNFCGTSTTFANGCARTCSGCADLTSTAAPDTTQGDKCGDNVLDQLSESQCAFAVLQNFCAISSNFFALGCARSCNGCDPIPTTTTAAITTNALSCADLNDVFTSDQCQFALTSAFCDIAGGTFAVGCKRTCHGCDPITSTAASTNPLTTTAAPAKSDSSDSSGSSGSSDPCANKQNTGAFSLSQCHFAEANNFCAIPTWGTACASTCNGCDA